MMHDIDMFNVDLENFQLIPNIKGEFEQFIDSETTSCDSYDNETQPMRNKKR